MPTPPQQTSPRFVALDVHKRYVMVGGLDAQYQVVLPLCRVPLDQFPRWAQTHLRRSDAVVIEATTNTWTLYDQVAPLVARTVVAHPPAVKLIVSARVKTDKHAVLSLARLLAADLIPEVWVPPVEVRELRALLTHRSRLLKMRTMTRNRLQSLLHRHNLSAPAGKIFTQKHRAWWQSLTLSPAEQLRLRQDLATLDHLEPQIAEVNVELARLSTQEPWAERVPYLIQLPGFGLLTAMTVLAAIGDIARFPHAKKLVGYAGLGTSVHASGQTHRTGRITKQGRKELRWILVEAARTAARAHPFWRGEFARLEKRRGSNKATVALARKLLVVVWHVLTARTVDRQADPEKVAAKLMTWSWQLNDDLRGGLATRQFVRYHLLRLRIGDELTHIGRGSSQRGLAPVEEVLALRPELQLTS